MKMIIEFKNQSQIIEMSQAAALPATSDINPSKSNDVIPICTSQPYIPIMNRLVSEDALQNAFEEVIKGIYKNIPKDTPEDAKKRFVKDNLKRITKNSIKGAFKELRKLTPVSIDDCDTDIKS